MNRTAVVAILSLLVSLVSLGCDEDNSNPVTHGLSVQFLDHTNKGCSASRDSSKYDCFGAAFLNSLEVAGDTLTLDIHFEANCCPGFNEDVSFDNSTVEIVVVDTLYGCRCICPFDNEFSFLFTGSGDLQIDFRSAALPDSFCVSSFDTVITLPK